MCYIDFWSIGIDKSLFQHCIKAIKDHLRTAVVVPVLEPHSSSRVSSALHTACRPSPFHRISRPRRSSEIPPPPQALLRIGSGLYYAAAPFSTSRHRLLNASPTLDTAAERFTSRGPPLF